LRPPIGFRTSRQEECATSAASGRSFRWIEAKVLKYPDRRTAAASTVITVEIVAVLGPGLLPSFVLEPP